MSEGSVKAFAIPFSTRRKSLKASSPKSTKYHFKVIERAVFIFALGGWLLLLLYPVIVDPAFWMVFGWYTLILVGFIIVMGFLGFILVIFLFRWRKDIPGHRKGLISTGIVGMIFTGTVPGLLILLSAALYPTN